MSISIARLTAHVERLAPLRTVELFAREPGRADSYCVEVGGLRLDYARQRLDVTARAALLELAAASALPERIASLLRGELVNPTEQRPALHTALRDPAGHAAVDGVAVAPQVAATLSRMEQIAGRLREGQWKGTTGESMTDVVNLGIGGSHLGPQLVCQALRELTTGGLRVHFVANVDGGDLTHCLRDLNPARTLFIVASKSFTTPETALNAHTARHWLQAALGADCDLSRHFLAITAHPGRAEAFGIAADNVLPMWDWVGGRYSLWSAIGLPIACACGMPVFRELLAGAHALDRHFATAPLGLNLPVMLALLGVWNTNALDCETHAVVSYDERLALLPAWLQQLEMESNGKRVGLDDLPVTTPTAPITWGGVGTNAQHAFFQLLHQGTRRIPVDFILPLSHPGVPRAHHDMLVANCIAQAEALMVGRSAHEILDASPGSSPALARHREQPGDQPSSVLTLDALTPHTLGALLAAYEHKTYVQGVLWGINPFDQWGVELGKTLAARLLAEIDSGAVSPAHDPATQALLARYLAQRDP